MAQVLWLRALRRNRAPACCSHACWNALVQKGGIDYLEDAWFLDVYKSSSSGSVLGGLIYHAADGRFISVKAPSVVIACGGLSTMYFPHTDTMRGNTGDSYAIAARAGAQLVDMEQVQFIPFAVASPPSFEGLVIGEPVSAGLLGVIRDGQGRVIKGELMVRTRAECAAAIATAVAQGHGTANGGCYLDLTANARGRSGEIFTSLMNSKLKGIVKIVKLAYGQKAARFEEPWEVRPSAHYCMGGVRCTDQGQVLDAQSDIIPGLFVAGQALGGLHGSNRLGSTSLAEGIIFGRRAGHCAAGFSDDEAAQDGCDWAQLASHENDTLASLYGHIGPRRRSPSHPFDSRTTGQLLARYWAGTYRIGDSKDPRGAGVHRAEAGTGKYRGLPGLEPGPYKLYRVPEYVGLWKAGRLVRCPANAFPGSARQARPGQQCLG